MAQTVIRAAEAVGNVPSSRNVRDVSKGISYLDPDSAPLIVVTKNIRGGSKAATNTKFEWIEKDLPARFDQINNGAGYTSGSTGLVVDNAAYFSVGDIVNVPRTLEKFRVTVVTVGSNTLTVVRGVGSTAAAALVDNDDLQIIGNAYAENSKSGSEKSHQETYVYNHTQIFRTALGVSRSEQNTENYTGDDRTRLRAEKGIEHKIDLERSVMFGERANDVTAPDNPRRMMGGVFYYLTGVTNTTDANGTLSEPEIESFLETVFAHTASGDTRLLLASPLVISVLDLISLSRIQTAVKDDTFGLTVKTWVTGHGTLNVVKHRLLENGVGGQGYRGFALALDMSKMKFRPLRNSDTQLHEDIQDPDLDGFRDEYLTEAGIELRNPLVHGILKGVTG